MNYESRETRKYYENLLSQLEAHYDSTHDQIFRLQSNLRRLEQELEDTRIDYDHAYPCTIDGWKHKLAELDPAIEGEEYDGKRDGILAEIEAIADREGYNE